MLEAKPPCFIFAKIDIILSQLFWDLAFVLAELGADVFEAG